MKSVSVLARSLGVAVDGQIAYQDHRSVKICSDVAPLQQPADGLVGDVISEGEEASDDTVVISALEFFAFLAVIAVFVLELDSFAQL